MPHHDDAERVCIGSMLLESNNIAQVLEFLTPDDFYRRSHVLIYTSIIRLFEADSEVDPVLVSDELIKNNELAEAGGLEYLDALTEGIPRTTNIAYYAGIVKQRSLLRRLARLGQEITESALSPETDADLAITEAETMLFDLREGRAAYGFRDLPGLLAESYEIIEKRAENKGELVGLGTGFADFDRITNGLQKGDLIIVAARPAMGKTSFCLNVGLNAALRGAKVALYSLEMPAAQLTMRLIGSEARVSISSLRSGNLNGDEWNRLGTTVANLNEAEIYIEDSGESTVAKMRAELKRLRNDKGLDLVIIDYLQLMTSSSVNAQQSRVQEVSAISRGLKILAKEVDCPVIALSQLSRAAEQRSDHRPQLSDLRESGSIEQDADMVCFLFREDYYKEKAKSETDHQPTDEEFGIAELIIAKHRNGPTGVVELAFFKKYTRFENYSDDIDYA